MKRRRHQRKPVSRWPGRLLRGLRFDRNPLRRGSDRLETLLTGALIVVFAVAAPLAGRAGASWEHAAAAREMRAQQTLIHDVPATLLQAVPAWDPGLGGYLPEAQARWTAPAGRARTGWIFVAGGAAKGSTVHIWVNQTGALSDPPLQPSQITGRTQIAQWAAVAVLAAFLLTVWALVRRALDACRMAAWDAEWLANGPRWSPRRG